jgi:hypothetical protein
MFVTTSAYRLAYRANVDLDAATRQRNKTKRKSTQVREFVHLIGLCDGDKAKCVTVAYFPFVLDRLTFLIIIVN